MEEEKKLETKKKGNGLLITIIVLLVIIILLLGFYICYDKGIIFQGNAEKDKEATEKKEKTEEEENIEFSESELEEYVNSIRPVNIGPSALIYNSNGVKESELSPREKIEYIGVNLNMKAVSNGNEAYLSENDVKNAVEKVYGPNTYEKTTFNLGCGDYVLEEATGRYVTITGCGGSSTTIVSNPVVEYKATNKKLEITTAYAFYSIASKKMFKDFDLQMEIESRTDDASPMTEESLKEYAKVNQDRLFHITYVFESTDGNNYYFKEFKNDKNV